MQSSKQNKLHLHVITLSWAELETGVVKMCTCLAEVPVGKKRLFKHYSVSNSDQI